MRTTSSSISSSEPSPWAGFAPRVVAATLAGLALMVALVVALDPYDTGRLGLAAETGTTFRGPRQAHVSRVRDPRFTGLVLGDSHVNLIDPRALTAGTGVPFVSLAIPGTGAPEQTAILDYYLARRGPPAAVLHGLDAVWCRPAAEFPTRFPFPYWLYATSDLAYLRGIVRWQAVEGLGRRVAHLLGRARPEPADAYFDYGLGRTWNEAEVRAAVARPTWTAFQDPEGRYPALDALAARYRALGPGTRIVLLMPPLPAEALPKPGTPGAAAEAACRTKFAAVAASLPNAALVDWRTDRPETRDLRGFWDGSHMTRELAVKVEAEVAAAFRALR